MQRRSFLKSSILLGGLGWFPNLRALADTSNLGMKEEGSMPFTLPDLPYAFDALEPYIDKMTMQIHHDKHQGAYVTNLNKAIEGTEWGSKTLEEILAGITKLPVAVRNNGGGHWNHSAFWKWMKPQGGGVPGGELAHAIDRDFGSFDKFKEQFGNAAMTRFGSGWAWLIHQHGKLLVASSPNQDNPLMDVADIRGVPILGLDVWEHAYYLKYQNRRADYVAAFWNLINWEEVSNRFAAAK